MDALHGAPIYKIDDETSKGTSVAGAFHEGIALNTLSGKGHFASVKAISKGRPSRPEESERRQTKEKRYETQHAREAASGSGPLTGHGEKADFEWLSGTSWL